MSQTNGDPVMYALYAVLVHSGYSCHAGHYYCYVKVSISTQLCCMHEATNYWLAVGSVIPLADRLGKYLKINKDKPFTKYTCFFFFFLEECK